MGEFENQKFDDFLKKHAPMPPASPLGEKQRIWREIEASRRSRFSWQDWLSFSQLRLAAVPALALLALLAVQLNQKRRHDLETERVLAAALSYQLEGSEEPSLF